MPISMGLKCRPRKLKMDFILTVMSNGLGRKDPEPLPGDAGLLL